MFCDCRLPTSPLLLSASHGKTGWRVVGCRTSSLASCRCRCSEDRGEETLTRFQVVTEEISTAAAWVLCILQRASSFMLPLINFPQLRKVNDLASRDSQITGAEPPLPASMGHLSVTFIYWINPPVSSRRTTAKWPLIVGWCADETNLQRDYKPLFLPLLLLSLWDRQ